MDTAMRHWVTVVAEEEAFPEDLGHSIQRLAAYFYAEKGLITSTWVVRLQRAFNAFTDLFEHVRLRKKFRKMVIMVYQL